MVAKSSHKDLMIKEDNPYLIIVIDNLSVSLMIKLLNIDNYDN
jgi:hypothetical protein